MYDSKSEERRNSEFIGKCFFFSIIIRHNLEAVGEILRIHYFGFAHSSID